MVATRRFVVIGGLCVMGLASASVAEALTPGKYVCQLSGGNSIVVRLQITQQAVLSEGSLLVPVFSAVGE